MQTTALIFDSSFLIRLDRARTRSGAAGDSLRRYAESRKASCILCPKVREELIDTPKSKKIYLKSVARFEKLLSSFWIHEETVDYTDPRICQISDRARKRISKVSGRNEHLIERADLEIICLIFQKIFRGSKVIVAFRDRAMRNTLENLISANRCEDKVEIVDVDSLIEAL